MNGLVMFLVGIHFLPFRRVMGEEKVRRRGDGKRRNGVNLLLLRTLRIHTHYLTRLRGTLPTTPA